LRHNPEKVFRLNARPKGFRPAQLFGLGGGKKCPGRKEPLGRGSRGKGSKKVNKLLGKKGPPKKKGSKRNRRKKGLDLTWKSDMRLKPGA